MYKKLVRQILGFSSWKRFLLVLLLTIALFQASTAFNLGLSEREIVKDRKRIFETTIGFPFKYKIEDIVVPYKGESHDETNYLNLGLDLVFWYLICVITFFLITLLQNYPRSVSTPAGFMSVNKTSNILKPSLIVVFTIFLPLIFLSSIGSLLWGDISRVSLFLIGPISILFIIIIELALYGLYMYTKTETEKNIYLTNAIVLGLAIIIETTLRVLISYNFYIAHIFANGGIAGFLIGQATYSTDPYYVPFNTDTFVFTTTGYFILISFLMGILYIITGLAFYVLYLHNKIDKNKKFYGEKFIIKGLAAVTISIFIPIFYIAYIFLVCFTVGCYHHM